MQKGGMVKHECLSDIKINEKYINNVCLQISEEHIVISDNIKIDRTM
jgi:hypothetical protein